MKEIGRICREHKVFFHTDAAQAVGKVPVNVQEHNIDLMSISGHKIYGPKGIGAIYIRRRPRVRLEPQMSGGGQVGRAEPCATTPCAVTAPGCGPCSQPCGACAGVLLWPPLHQSPMSSA